MLYRYQIPEEWPYNEARKLFKEPDVLTDEEQLDIKWTSPDEEVGNLFPLFCATHFFKNLIRTFS